MSAAGTRAFLEGVLDSLRDVAEQLE